MDYFCLFCVPIRAGDRDNFEASGDQTGFLAGQKYDDVSLLYWVDIVVYINRGGAISDEICFPTDLVSPPTCVWRVPMVLLKGYTDIFGWKYVIPYPAILGGLDFFEGLA
jgi:hypothetical protein